MEQGKQMRFTEDELRLVQETFKNNEKLLKVMRKVFLPELDPDAPLGQVIDLWVSIPLKEMNPQDAMVNMLARNQLIMHVEQQLMQLQSLANREQLTEEQRQLKEKKDKGR
jgi:hypothetical protein